MYIALDIPDNIPNVVAPDQNPVRAALEALALEGYRSERLSEYDVRELLGFTTPMQVHGFLKEHGVHMHYSMADFESDIRVSNRIVRLSHAREARGEQRPG